jgi:hydroxymethylpyrimidine pyrophosphatase-like HAD family hydrolase
MLRLDLYKLLLSDLDGTLRAFGGGVSPAVKQAVQDAMRAGCRFSLATGRVLQSVLQ